MTHLSLFSGIGGIDLAAHWAGFRTVQFVEKDPFCQKVLAKNFPGVPIHDDVTTYQHSGESPTIVSAGFPCQPHSLAGKRKASRDHRDLWAEVARVLREARPTWFLGENVPGLFSSEKGAFFGWVLNDLAALGYCVSWGVIRASDLGAAHQRARVVIVAYSQYQRSHARQIARGVGAGKEEGRVLQLERCTPTNTDGERFSEPMPATIPGFHGFSGWFCNPLSIGTGDWRTWPVEPVIRGVNDGVSRKLHASRLKALGNAVRPQQIYPVLKAIADFEGERVSNEREDTC